MSKYEELLEAIEQEKSRYDTFIDQSNDLAKNLIEELNQYMGCAPDAGVFPIGDLGPSVVVDLRSWIKVNRDREAVVNLALPLNRPEPYKFWIAIGVGDEGRLLLKLPWKNYQKYQVGVRDEDYGEKLEQIIKQIYANIKKDLRNEIWKSN